MRKEASKCANCKFVGVKNRDVYCVHETRVENHANSDLTGRLTQGAYLGFGTVVLYKMRKLSSPGLYFFNVTI